MLDDDRYWDIVVDYAKAAPDDICVRVSVRNAGPDEATIDVLPTLWFRNTWSWGLDDRRPVLAAKDGAVVAEHHALGRMTLTGSRQPELLFCENESDAVALWDAPPTTPYPKDGIARHVVSGASTVNPDQTGTKAALHYRLTVAPGETVELQLRLRADSDAPSPSWPSVMAGRHAEADEYYAALTPAGVDRRGGRRHAPGLRRDAVVEAVLPLRRRPLARGRPRRPSSARGAEVRPQRRLAAPEHRTT